MTATITCAGCTHAYADTALFCPNCGRPKVRDIVGDALLGKVLGERFQVQEQIGQGGSGTIYRAEHITLRRKVAIKVLHNELSRDDLAVERFRREATTVAEIDNEHIVEIHDFGRTPDGRLYLAMELLEGETLDAVLVREQRLTVERTADILIQVGEALMEAHAIGYVHRDLRPRNVYLAVRRGKANFVKLLDFGLAKLVETDAQAASTSLGMTFGDPRYMSPEQARGDRIDRRADVYQLGCVAYEMLTGAPPFSGNRVFDILTKQVTEIPAPLPTRRPGVPLWMEAAVTKMLAKDPENRFATTTRMVEALRRGLDSGEVMDDEIARRRESIPPPSVSRVMQRMGLAPNESPAAVPPSAAVSAPPSPSVPAPPPPSAAVPAPPPPSVPAPPPPSAAVPAHPGTGPGFDGRQTVRGHSPTEPQQALPASSPQTIPSSVPGPAPRLPHPAEQPIPSAAVPAPVAAEAFDPGRTSQGVAVPTAKPDSVELLRRRTGTPRMGVPIGPTPPVPSPVQPPAYDDPTQAPVAGVIEPARPATAEPAFVRNKRDDDRNISQVWYEDGDLDSDEADSRVQRARKMIAPSATDSFYDEVPRRRRWGLIVASLGVLLAGGVALAVGLGRDSSSTTSPPPPLEQPVVAAAPTPDAAPSTIIESADAAAQVAVAPAPPPPVPAPPKAERKSAPEAERKSAPEPTRVAAEPRSKDRKPPDVGSFTPTEPTFRRPGGDPPPPKPPDPVPVKPPVVKDPPTNGGTGTTGVSGVEGPEDPYNGGGETPPVEGAPPEKRAEFFANLGTQQLIGGDAANAAANFKKALELDPKSATAMIGMGEIAQRQGLFGDAIAHLKKAARLAPRNARVFTLLGEAYLALANNSEAAANFKKALQIDPDNQRARDGYNEASSRVPPPTDE